jgi:hypothetical protein
MLQSQGCSGPDFMTEAAKYEKKIEKEEVGLARCGFVLQLPGVCPKAGLSQVSNS